MPPAALSNIAAGRFIDFIQLTRFFSLTVSEPLNHFGTPTSQQMMSSFTTLKKISRFQSACPSSGPVTFCEGGPGHVHIRSHRVLTRDFLHQPCASLKSRIESTCPSSGPATFCEGSQPRLRTQSGHVRPRTQLSHQSVLQLSDCTRLRPSGSVGTKHFLGPPLPLGLYRRYLWVSRHQTLSWASSASGSFLFGRMHQQPPPLMPRQPLPLELSFGLLISGQIH